jgi:NAD(P)-dependent dehydrogenase (short-subunit alcohol dehydrogenase family)
VCSSKRLKIKGVYVITGGLGGIGLTLAEFLAAKVQARLLLISRSPFPIKETWDNWIQEHDAEDLTCQKIQTLRRLESLGASVAVAQADITKKEEIQPALKSALKEFGNTIDGVIHAAGVPGGEVIQRKTRESVEKIQSAKVQGSLNLYQAVKEYNPDFLVFCSSLAAVTGGVGQADYCAANAYMDSLAHALKKTGFPAFSINWDTWNETGMAVQSEMPAELQAWWKRVLELGISPQEGVRVFESILIRDLPRVFVSTYELNGRVDGDHDDFVHAMNNAHINTRQKSNDHYERPELNSPFAAPENEVEVALANIWSDLLGIHPIGIHDDFNDLGGHSLLATQVISRIKDEYGVVVSLPVFFQSPTIACIGEIILMDQVSDDELSQILEEIEDDSI